MLRDQKGFTLMELMIVIVIIGVLAAIGVPSYRGYVAKANKAQCQANQRTIETALGMAQAEKDEAAFSGDWEAIQTEVSGYIDNIGTFKCNAGGTYSAVSGDVQCSNADHNN